MSAANKYLLIRILGNDIPSLHGTEQTLKNLEFLLQHEEDFPETKKLFVLNRIIDTEKRRGVIALLEQYGYDYREIPYSSEDLLARVTKGRIWKAKFFLSLVEFTERAWPARLQKDRFEVFFRKKMIQSIADFSLYACNINGARNFAVEQCQNYAGTEWVFPFDGNCFFTKEGFTELVNAIQPETRYLAIPLKRLNDKGLSNEDLLKEHPDMQEIPIYEPQVGFHARSKMRFNEEILFGLANKCEMLNALQFEGRWNHWRDHEAYLGIPLRQPPSDHYTQVLSAVYRLSAFKSGNTTSNNWLRRWRGLIKMMEQLNS